MTSSTTKQKILIYLLRRDLRLADNPVFHEISSLHAHSKGAPFTHVLPLYVFPAQQVEISGFLSPPSSSSGSNVAIEAPKSPYPEARSAVGGFWRCGQYRAKFLAQSVWDLKQNLENVGSGLAIRVGMLKDVVSQTLKGLEENDTNEVTSLWMTEDPGIEEKQEERSIRSILEAAGKDFRIFRDEKYFIDDRDLPFSNPKDLPDVFTTFRKQVEPLRDAPRRCLPISKKLPPLPPSIPSQSSPFEIPSNLDDLISALEKPLLSSVDLQNPPQKSKSDPPSAHPFTGGETTGLQRVNHLLSSGAMTTYKDTRNGLLGTDFSTKLSAWLALGCITARQVHFAMLDFEDGRAGQYKGAHGYGEGENKGTAAVRFELLWRDYFHLITRKFGPRLFRASGLRADENIEWGYDKEKLNRWLEGRTGMGLIDAAQRELYLTGYTSNRTRQNVASFLSKHLFLDWRLGAEWYESCLVDYDVGSNWGNWQYNSGVGNDPREGGIGRKFNPVKQAFDYDSNAEYVKSWVEEVKDVAESKDAFQYSQHPLVRIDYKPPKGGAPGARAGKRKNRK